MGISCGLAQMLRAAPIPNKLAPRQEAVKNGHLPWIAARSARRPLSAM
jgi:hypothetical protein